MTHTYNPAATYDAAYTFPDDGDSDASAVNVPLSALADGLKYTLEKGVEVVSFHNDAINTGWVNVSSLDWTNIIVSNNLISTAKPGDKLQVSAIFKMQGDTPGSGYFKLQVGVGTTFEDVPGSMCVIASAANGQARQLVLQGLYTIGLLGVGDLRIALVGKIAPNTEARFAFSTPYNITVQLLRRS